MPGIVDPMDWERGQRDAKISALEERMEASSDPDEQRALKDEIRQTRKDFRRKMVRRRLRDIFAPYD